MPANLAELIEQLPATDREVELRKQAAQPVDPAKPPPRPDRPGSGSKFTGPAPADAWKLCEQVLADGKAGVIALIRLVVDPAADGFVNYKAEYLVHCLVLFAGQSGKAQQRQLVAEALAAELGNETLSLHTRGYLIRELEWVGEAGAVPALGRLLTNEALSDDAVRTLLSIGGDAALEQLRRTLPLARGRLRLVLLQALGNAKDVPSTAALREGLGDADPEVRVAAALGLARIGDAGSVDALLKLAGAPRGWERLKATSACFLLAEKLVETGRKTDAAKIYASLRETRTDPKERHFREAADRGARGLGVV
jgi:hypothetical protein